MKGRTQVTKMVRWSAEDGCYIGTCPSLFYGGVHGNNEAAVYRALSKAVASCARTDRSRTPRTYRKRTRRYARK